MTYAQAQDEHEKGKDVVLTIRNSRGKTESVTLKAADYELPCDFMVACNNLLRGYKKEDFVFSAV